MTEQTIRVVSMSADFYPEDAPKDTITWTFIAHRSVGVGAGVYELRFVRPLNDEERATEDYREALR